jgi:hypothetical protein
MINLTRDNDKSNKRSWEIKEEIMINLRRENDKSK